MLPLRPAHPAFADLIDIGAYASTLHERHTSHAATSSKPKNRAYPYLSNEGTGSFGFWHVWPNMTFGSFPGSPHFSVFRSHPVSPARTWARGMRLRLPGAPTPEEAPRNRYIAEVLWPECGFRRS